MPTCLFHKWLNPLSQLKFLPACAHPFLLLPGPAALNLAGLPWALNQSMSLEPSGASHTSYCNSHTCDTETRVDKQSYLAHACVVRLHEFSVGLE